MKTFNEFFTESVKLVNHDKKTSTLFFHGVDGNHKDYAVTVRANSGRLLDMNVHYKKPLPPESDHTLDQNIHDFNFGGLKDLKVLLDEYNINDFNIIQKQIKKLYPKVEK